MALVLSLAIACFVCRRENKLAMKIAALTKTQKVVLGVVIAGALAYMVVAEERAFERYPCPARLGPKPPLGAATHVALGYLAPTPDLNGMLSFEKPDWQRSLYVGPHLDSEVGQPITLRQRGVHR